MTHRLLNTLKLEQSISAQHRRRTHSISTHSVQMYTKQRVNGGRTNDKVSFKKGLFERFNNPLSLFQPSHSTNRDHHQQQQAPMPAWRSPPMPKVCHSDSGQLVGFFFGVEHLLSNFHPCHFVLDGRLLSLFHQ